MLVISCGSRVEVIQETPAGGAGGTGGGSAGTSAGSGAANTGEAGDSDGPADSGAAGDSGGAAGSGEADHGAGSASGGSSGQHGGAGGSAGNPSCVTVPYLFRYAPPIKTPTADVTTVAVTGDFDTWRMDGPPLTKDTNGVFKAIVEMPPGKSRYKFVLNGRELVSDPANPMGENDGFGGLDSILLLSCGVDYTMDPGGGAGAGGEGGL